MSNNKKSDREFKIPGTFQAWAVAEETAVIGHTTPAPTLTTIKLVDGKWSQTASQPVFRGVSGPSAMRLAISSNTLVVALPSQTFGHTDRSGVVRVFSLTDDGKWSPIQTITGTPPIVDGVFGSGMDLNALTLALASGSTKDAAGAVQILSFDGTKFGDRTEVCSYRSQVPGWLQFVGPDIAADVSEYPIFGENVDDGTWAIRGHLPAGWRRATDERHLFVSTPEGTLYVLRRSDSGYLQLAAINLREQHPQLAPVLDICYFDNTIWISTADALVLVYRRKGANGRWEYGGASKRSRVASRLRVQSDWLLAIENASEANAAVLSIGEPQRVETAIRSTASAIGTADAPELLYPIGPIAPDDVDIYFQWAEVPGVTQYRVRATAPRLKGCRINGRARAGVAAMNIDVKVDAELSCSDGVCWFRLHKVEPEYSPCPNNPRYVVQWEVASVDEGGESTGYPVQFWRPAARASRVSRATKPRR